MASSTMWISGPANPLLINWMVAGPATRETGTSTFTCVGDT